MEATGLIDTNLYLFDGSFHFLINYTNDVFHHIFSLEFKHFKQLVYIMWIQDSLIHFPLKLTL